MKIIQKTAVSLALIAMSVSAFSNAANVGGVTWDPDYQSPPPIVTDLTMDLSYSQWFVAGTDAGTYDASKAISSFNVVDGDELQGGGRVTKFNGLVDPEVNPTTGFCLGCELTFEFGGLIASGNSFTFANAFFDFYVETGTDVDTFYDKGVGTPWLTLAVDDVTFAAQDILNTYIAGQIDVLFSSVAGPAQFNFDTNTIPIP